jgi:hypothetical protein
MTMTDTTTLEARTEAFKLTNALVELSKMLSVQIWTDESNDERFKLGALADSIHSAAEELHDLVQAK